MPSKIPLPPSERAATRHITRILGLALLLMALAACGPSVVKPNADDKAIASARQLGYQGQHAAAADALLALAAKEKSPFRQEFELDAAEQLLRVPENARAGQVLAAIDLSQADETLRSRHQLLGARVALGLSDPSRALALLNPRYPGASPADQLLRVQLRVIARSQLGQTVDAIRERLQLSTLLGDADRYARNLDGIWTGLGELDGTTLANLTRQYNEPDLQAWAELALIDRDSGFDYLQFQQRANDWRVRHPNHPAASTFLDNLIAAYAAPLETPSQIALLLPLSGRYAAQAAAVRDGLFTAHYDRQTVGAPSVAVHVYDTADGQRDIADLYAQAVADGARVVVGPLAKPAVEQLAALPELSVPVLALNHADGAGASPNFYQFGLPPEDEAVAIARRAIASGLPRAILITSEGGWGNRLTNAFRDALARDGGQALAVARLPATSSDYRDVLQSALLLDQSLARRQDVNARIGTRTEFEPRRREDAQVILVAADARQMRSLRPQLEFHHAEGLPIIAVSNIYSGFPDATADRDLNGVLFADSPWRIDDATSAPSERLAVDRFWPDRNAQAGNLFALGVDAYRLLPYIPRLNNATGTTVDGASGQLYLDENRQVHRVPVFALFRNGMPSRAPDVIPSESADVAPPTGI